MTPDWNPQNEEQAIARCHRIGQKKEVFVFRFIMNSFNEDENDSSNCISNNIEQYIEKTQKIKIRIANEIFE